MTRAPLFKVKWSKVNLQGAVAYCGGLPHSLFIQSRVHVSCIAFEILELIRFKLWLFGDHRSGVLKSRAHMQQLNGLMRVVGQHVILLENESVNLQQA